MTTFPNSPRLLKGALIALDTFTQAASPVIFQYNPEKMTRTLKAQTSDKSGAPSEALRLTGAPTEDIKIDVEIDATDQLETQHPLAVSLGINPQLAALEMLLYPKSSRFIGNRVLAALGTIEIIPPEAPLTLFIWGPTRVLPVRVTTFTITEQAYDVRLNPIRAEVSLGLQVLTYDDFPVEHPGSSIFLAHQIVKETMALLANTV